MMLWIRNFVKEQRGAAAAEMVLVLPFLIVLLFGSVELATYFYSEHQVLKGVRDGARFGGRQAFSAIKCSGATPQAIPADVEEAIIDVTRTGQIDGDTARVSGWTDADVTVTVDCPLTADVFGSGSSSYGLYMAETNVPRLTVSTSFKYQSLFGGLGVIDNTFDLRASQEAAVMGL